MQRLTIAGLLFLSLHAMGLPAAEPVFVPSAERGYELLTTRAYLPPDLDEDLFGELWKVWPEALRERAAKETAAERRQMAFARYGFQERPDRDADAVGGPPINYVDDGKGGWVANCFLCHAGKVAGRVIPGLPNSHIAMKTFADDVRLAKLLTGRGLSKGDLGKITFPLGSSNGTTNATSFGIAYGAMRQSDMSVGGFKPLSFEHHDIEPPPWWHAKRRETLYIDGFATKSHRVLMQFVLDPTNDAERVQGWEDDFRHVLAYIESLQPPAYPWEVDRQLAATGRTLFEANCATCHGTYGEGGTYPERSVPLDVVRTDPVRLRALTPEHRGWLAESWLSRYGEDAVRAEPTGYVAPPLDGLWATAPYLHNGSVPTLWHLLHPEERPTVWRRTDEGYDRDRIGLEAATFDDVPAGVPDAAERRWYFDTRVQGKSAAGHDFPNALDAPGKRAVLEYLKTL
jgi:cytochrome c5